MPRPAYPGFSVRIRKMGREEQIEEREVLDSIFPDEITGNNHVYMAAPAKVHLR